MTERVRDRRSLYFGLGASEVQNTEDIPYEARSFSGTVYTAASPLYVAAAVFGGLIAEAGAAEVRVRLFDGQNAADALASNRKASLRTSVFDGFLLPVRLSKGILLTIDQADAIVTVFFKT